MDKVQVLIVEVEAIVAMDLLLPLERMAYSVAGVTHSGEEAARVLIRMWPMSRDNPEMRIVTRVRRGGQPVV